MRINQMYGEMLHAILETGYTYQTANRPNVNCIGLPSAYMPIPLTEVPAITTKKLAYDMVISELVWFLKGLDNLEFLHVHKNRIWDKDAKWFDKENGMDVGRNYGVQWRSWSNFDWIHKEPHYAPELDQFDTLINDLIQPNPITRRNIVTAWNPAELSLTALPPCHFAFIVIPYKMGITERIKYSTKDKIYLETLWNEAYMKNDKEAKNILDQELSDISTYGMILKCFMRSVDMFLGLPFNILSYAILAYLIGEITSIVPTELHMDLSDIHIYEPHKEVVEKQLKNNPNAFGPPTLKFADELKDKIQELKKGEFFDVNQLFHFLEPEHIIIEGYKSFEKLSAPMFEPTV